MNALDDNTAARQANTDALDELTAVLERLGARWSPDLDAYASGQLPAHMVRCVLCGHAPCSCTYCPATHENSFYMVTGRPQYEPCGMRVDPATGECPRGHQQEGTQQ